MGSSCTSNWETQVQSRKHYQLALWVPLSQCQPDRWSSHYNNESIDITTTITRVQLYFLIGFHNDFSKWFSGFCCVLDRAAELLIIHQSSIVVSDHWTIVVSVQDWQRITITLFTKNKNIEEGVKCIERSAANTTTQLHAAQCTYSISNISPSKYRNDGNLPWTC